jgi:hypothetical protein
MLLPSALGACGGAGGVSKAKIIKSGDAVCRRAADELLAAPKQDPGADPLSPYATSADWVGMVRNVEIALPVLRHELDGFRSLGGPDSDVPTFRQMVADLATEYADGVRVDGAARVRDRRAFAAASDAFGIAEGKWLSLADRFGFADCTTSGM